MANQGFATPAIEGVAIKNKRLSFEVSLFGSTTEASVTASTTGNSGIRVWLSSQSATAPSNANFASLTSAATPTVIGIYITDGQAIRMGGATVHVNSIRSASMTAGVITDKGATSAIAGNTGVTSDGNIAFQVSCTTLLLTAAALNHKFYVDCTYDVK